jgi:hypothetical protein
LIFRQREGAAISRPAPDFPRQQVSRKPAASAGFSLLWQALRAGRDISISGRDVIEFAHD